MPKKASRRRMSTIPMTAANLPIKAARTATRGATNLYKKSIRTMGNTANVFMKPTTKFMSSTARKVPVIGGVLHSAARAPRRITRAAVAAGLSVPRVAKGAAGTSMKVMHAMLDPVLSPALVVMGLSPSGRPGRSITVKKSPKKTSKRK